MLLYFDRQFSFDSKDHILNARASTQKFITFLYTLV